MEEGRDTESGRDGTGDDAYACVLAVGDDEEERGLRPLSNSHALNAAVAPSRAEPENTDHVSEAARADMGVSHP